jgi:5-formyltetrahydrofolate cyclo-ligase
MVGSDEDVLQRKRRLREQALTGRAALPEHVRQAAGQRLARAGVQLVRARRPARVAAYLAVATEPPTAPLLEGLRAIGISPLLPVVRPDGLLDWAEHPPGVAWRAGRFGVPEPAGRPLGCDALAETDLALLPALAVDPRGRRLGRGGGYVDRALHRARPAAALAVVYDHELLEEVPAGPGDEPVDGVLLPAGERWFDRSRDLPRPDAQ